MTNPLLVFWYRLFAGAGAGSAGAPRWRVPMASSRQASATIFLVMRKMRAPLIVLIVIFAITTVGLTLIPGQDDAGRPWRMGFFDAFYVMSYTASTIGFGEIPYPFTYNQRMWVTISIYLTVDRLGVRDRLAARAGAGAQLPPGAGAAALHAARSSGCASRSCSSPATGDRRAARPARSTRWAAGSSSSTATATGSTTSTWTRYHADVPGLVADAGEPGHLAVAGLDHPALRGRARPDRGRRGEPRRRPDRRAAPPRGAGDHPGGLHGARPSACSAFGTPTVVNPFDRFGDHLRIALRAPASYQLHDLAGERARAPRCRRAAPPPRTGTG